MSYRHNKPENASAAQRSDAGVPSSTKGLVLPAGSPLVQFEITVTFCGQETTQTWVNRVPVSPRDYEPPECSCNLIFCVDDRESIRLLNIEGSRISLDKIQKIERGGAHVYVCRCVGRFVE